MSKKLSISEVRDIVIYEGIGYAVSDYLNGEHIENEELADLWIRAHDLLRDIEDMIENCE